MLQYPAFFLLLALIAGAFGYGGFTPGVAEFCKTLFFAFCALAALGCVVKRVRDPAESPEPGNEPGRGHSPGDYPVNPPPAARFRAGPRKPRETGSRDAHPSHGGRP